MSLVSLSLFPKPPLERSFSTIGCGSELDIATAMKKKFPGKPVFVLSSGDPGDPNWEPASSFLRQEPDWWLFTSGGFVHFPVSSWQLIVAAALLLVLSLLLTVAALWGLRLSSDFLLRALKTRLMKIRNNKVQILQSVALQALVRAATQKSRHKRYMEHRHYAEMALIAVDEELPDVAAACLLASALESNGCTEDFPCFFRSTRCIDTALYTCFTKVHVGKSSRTCLMFHANEEGPRPKNANEETRDAATRLLSSTLTGQSLTFAVHRLLDFMNDDNRSVRQEAAGTLVKLGPPACWRGLKILQQRIREAENATKELRSLTVLGAAWSPDWKSNPPSEETLTDNMLDSIEDALLDQRFSHSLRDVAEGLVQWGFHAWASIVHRILQRRGQLFEGKDAKGFPELEVLIEAGAASQKSSQYIKHVRKRMKALKSGLRTQVDPQMVTLLGEAAIWILNPAEVALAVTIARQDLSDTQGFKRAAKAAEALGLLGAAPGGAAKLAVPSLTQALARAAEVTIETSDPDRHWATRLAIHATETLSNFGSVDLLLVHQLGRALKNSDANLRKEAARACFVMRPPEVKLPVPLSKLIRKHAHPQRMGEAQAWREEQGKAFAQVVALQVCTLRPSLLLAGFPELSAHHNHIQSNLTELCQELCKVKCEEADIQVASDVQALISWQKEVLLPLDSIEIMGNMFAALQSALLDAFVGQEASFDFRKVIAEGFVGWGAPFVAGAMLRIQQMAEESHSAGGAVQDSKQDGDALSRISDD